MTFSFGLTALFYECYSTLGQGPQGLRRRTFGTADIGLFTGRMPFLSPNQQCQNTEAWQYRNQTCTYFHSLTLSFELSTLKSQQHVSPMPVSQLRPESLKNHRSRESKRTTDPERLKNHRSREAKNHRSRESKNHRSRESKKNTDPDRLKATDPKRLKTTDPDRLKNHRLLEWHS